MLRDDKVEEIREKNNYGYNVITPPPETPWWKLYLEKFEDPIIVILLVATGISLLFLLYLLLRVLASGQSIQLKRSLMR